jgi:gamma-glutamylcyclotransferase (GGCT)/AIG2-like uncharacterized protein YtfP
MKQPPVITSSEPLPFFVYGTLRPGFRLYRGLEALIERHEPARLPGFDLFISGYPVVRVSDGRGRYVTGDLLWMTDHDAALRRCDGIENYRPPYNTMYIRAAVLALRGEQPGIPVTAWVYMGGPRMGFYNRVESGDYLDVVRSEEARV